MTLRDLAWLSGWLEGEGCFLYKPAYGNGNASPRIAIEVFSTDRDVIEKGCSLIGGSIVEIKPRLQSNGGWRAQVFGYKAIGVMKAILPYMGQRRSTQITRALAAWENRPNRPVEKLCACGCGRKVFGRPRIIYARRDTGACAMRAWRQRHAA